MRFKKILCWGSTKKIIESIFFYVYLSTVAKFISIQLEKKWLGHVWVLLFLALVFICTCENHKKIEYKKIMFRKKSYFWNIYENMRNFLYLITIKWRGVRISVFKYTIIFPKKFFFFKLSLLKFLIYRNFLKNKNWKRHNDKI